MRRAIATATAVLAGLLFVPSAQAAAPTASTPDATDIQGVSALLTGTVNPGGEATTYRFEYGDQGPCDSNPCTSTATTAAGSDNSEHPARAAISGLTPDTTYYFRLVATNNSGTASATTPGGTPPGTFKTTAGFGFLAGTGGFSAAVIKDGNLPASGVGTHPYQMDLGLHFNQGGDFEGQPGVAFPDGDLRDLTLDLPPGLLMNPAALDKCSLTDFHAPRVSPFEQSQSGESCPDRTQIGTIEVASARDGGTPRSFGLYNLAPPPGVAAQIGASPFGSPLVFDVVIHTNDQGSYTLSLDATNVPQSLDISGLDLHAWGVPWNPSHDAQRGNCLNEAQPGLPWCKASVGDPQQDTGNTPLAYLTLPTSCLGPLNFSASADAWQQPAQVSAGAQNLNGGGQPVSMTGCSSISFTASPNGYLTDTKASSASGYNFQLSNDNPQLTNKDQGLPSQTRTAVVALPPGVSINPSLGAGLQSCTPAQYAAETALNGQGNGCPNGSKIGDFTVHTPLFSNLIGGAIYLAQPDDPLTATPGAENPFDTLIGIYLVAKSPERGVLVKVAGKLIPDPVTGNLVATFADLPQLPYTDLDVNFKQTQRAPLITPPSCGNATSTIDLTPWSGFVTKHSTTASAIVAGIGNGPCPAPGTPPFSPGVVAGGVNANVGSYTPYYVHITRKDTEQEITSYSLVLPKGITGKLAGIPFCPEADIEAARHKSGYGEAANPSCPDASLVGHTLTGYGIGSALTYASGRIYLAGPYHGAPLSLVTVNSATVGPFDLGTIVIRSAFDVDTHTAQLQIDSSASDPIPHIIDGIPLHLRDVRIYIDRPQFTHNPSSCEASQLASTLTGSGASFASSADDSTTSVNSYFQLLNCRTLGFKPTLGVKLRGGTKRNANPELTATFTARGPQDSNLKQISVVIPHQEFLAQNHIRGICTRARFDSQQCPADSVYGRAVAYTPLFDNPLTGKVYLRSAPGRKLPDLVADLYSGAVRIVLEGRIGPSHGGIQAFFANLPDEPLDRFTMTLAGGRRGLLVNSADICAVPPQVSVKALAQNNIGALFTTALRGQCKHKKRHHKKHKRHHKRHAKHKRHHKRGGR